MSQKQYLQMLEREIQRINQRIDLKILAGESYAKLARDHKLLLKKIRFHSRQHLLRKIFPTFAATF
jgi:hypothetical protein